MRIVTTVAERDALIPAPLRCEIQADGAWKCYDTPDELPLLSAEQIKAQQDMAFNAAIYAQLDEIDKRRVRPLAEGDTGYLAELNAQAVALRAGILR